MKMKNLMINTYMQIMIRKMLFIEVTLIMIISFLVIDYSLLIFGSSYLREIIMESVVDDNADNIHFLNTDKYKIFDADTINAFKDLLSDITTKEGVKYAGTYVKDIGVFHGIERNVLFISNDLLGMCNIKNIDAKLPSMISKEDYPAILVGYELKNEFPLGTLVHDEFSNMTYIVADVLKEGSKWLDDDISYGMYIDLDNCIVKSLDAHLDTDDYLIANGCHNICFQTGSRDEAESVKNEVMDCSEKRGLEIYSIYSLKEKLQWSRNELNSEKEELILSIVLFVVAVLAMLISSLITIHIRKKDIGILYANGYSTREISIMYVLENVAKIIVAYIVASSYWSVNQYQIYDWNVSIMWALLPVSGIIAGLLIVLSSLLPFITIHKLNPVELIGGKA